MAALMTAREVSGLAFNIRCTWTVPAVWRIDAPRELVSGRMQGWRERLNRMIFAARTWEGLETVERRFARMLANRAVRAAVYESNNHGR